MTLIYGRHVYSGEYLALEGSADIRVDGLNVKGKWKDAGNNILETPFPSELNFKKDNGEGYSLVWNVEKERLEGNLAEEDEAAFLCIEVCGELTTTTTTTEPPTTTTTQPPTTTTTEPPTTTTTEPTTTMLPESDKCGKGWVELNDETCIM